MTRSISAPELLSLGPLRVRKVVSSDSADPRGHRRSGLTVVLLHGYGANGSDLVALVERIDAPAPTTFLFPEAPGRLDDLVLLNLVDDARVWWARDARRIQRDVHGEHGGLETTVFEDIAPARSAVTEMLDALDARDPEPGRRIVLGGFSQGAILALEVAMRDPRPLAGLVLLSGAITDTELLTRMPARRGLPVFQAHGTTDARLSFPAAERLRDAMTDAGMAVRFCPFEDGHGIPEITSRQLGAWLCELDRSELGAHD